MARAVYAVIKDDGSIERHTGEVRKVNRLKTGRYQVEFRDGTFNSKPYVLATVMRNEDDCDSNGTNKTISITALSNLEVCLSIRDADSSSDQSNRRFSIQAIEP